jgi:hypothetical protein
MRNPSRRRNPVVPDTRDAELGMVEAPRGTFTIYVLARTGVTLLGTFDEIAAAWHALDALEIAA